LAPASLLLPLDISMMIWFQVLGSFTLFPLLIKDGLRIPYFLCSILFALVAYMYFKSLQEIEKRKISKNGNIHGFEEAPIQFQFNIKIFAEYFNSGRVSDKIKYVFICSSLLGNHLYI
jgi:hypothetical protein